MSAKESGSKVNLDDQSEMALEAGNKDTRNDAPSLYVRSNAPSPESDHEPIASSTDFIRSNAPSPEPVTEDLVMNANKHNMDVEQQSSEASQGHLDTTTVVETPKELGPQNLRQARMIAKKKVKSAALDKAIVLAIQKWATKRMGGLAFKPTLPAIKMHARRVGKATAKHGLSYIHYEVDRRLDRFLDQKHAKPSLKWAAKLATGTVHKWLKKQLD